MPSFVWVTLVIPNPLSFRCFAKQWHELVMMENSCHLVLSCCIWNIKWFCSLDQLHSFHTGTVTFAESLIRENYQGDWNSYFPQIDSFQNCSEKRDPARIVSEELLTTGDIFFLWIAPRYKFNPKYDIIILVHLLKTNNCTSWNM